MPGILIRPGDFIMPRIILIWIVLCLAAMPGQAENGLELPAGKIPDLIEKADRYFEKIHEDLSGLERAINIYEQVLEKDPDHVEARWKLAEVLFISAMEAGDKKHEKMFYEQSLEHARRALVSDALCVPALFYCGCARVSLAELVGTISAIPLLKKGKQELARVMESAPANRFGILAAGVLSQVNTDTPWPMKDLKEAEKLAGQAVAWDPNLTMASAQLAAVYWHQGNHDAARDEARRCLGIDRPTYMSDAVLWDWPAARKILEKVGETTGKQ